jgi:hypothetical protein
MSVFLNRANLASVQLASKDASRVHLHGLHVTPDETVATNGHALIRVKLPSVDDESATEFTRIAGESANGAGFSPVTLPAKAVEAAAKRMPNRPQGALQGISRLSTEGTHATLVTTDGESTTPSKFELDECDMFVDYESVLPKDEPTLSIGLNAGLLATVFKVLAQITAVRGTQKLQPVKCDVFTDSDENGKPRTPVTRALRLTCETASGQEVTVIVMPCRID